MKNKIKVIECVAHGAAFANLIPGSVHEIEKEDKMKNARSKPGKVRYDRRVWVQGVGELVALLPFEYEDIKE